MSFKNTLFHTACPSLPREAYFGALANAKFSMACGTSNNNDESDARRRRLPHVKAIARGGGARLGDDQNHRACIALRGCAWTLRDTVPHQPLSADERTRALHTVVALFREPSQRLMSAFYAHRHAVGLGDGTPHGERRERVRMRGNATFGATTPAQFARWPGIAGWVL